MKITLSDSLPHSSKVKEAQAAYFLALAMEQIWGDRLDTEGMQGTPGRVARHWMKITEGLHQDPVEPLKRTFPCDHNELVLIKDIPFNSLCEHHLLPFWGTAHVAYLPQGRVVGLSKIPRSLDIIAARPQMQERITHDLAKTIDYALNPAGVMVVIKAEHSCMATRGVLKQGAVTVTTSTLGIFAQDGNLKREVLSLL